MSKVADTATRTLPLFVLEGDAARWNGRKGQWGHGYKNLEDYAFQCVWRREYRQALDQFKTCWAYDRCEFRYIYYAITLSRELDISPDVYLRDIEFFEKSGGNVRLSALLRAIELVQRGLPTLAIGWVVEGLAVSDELPIAREVAVRVLHFAFLQLDGQNDPGSGLVFLSTLCRQAIYSERLRDVVLACMQVVELSDAFLASAVVRSLFALAGLAASEAFLKRHVQLLHHGPMAQEVLSLPSTAARQQELLLELFSQAISLSVRPNASRAYEATRQLFAIRQLVREAKSEGDLSTQPAAPELGEDLVALRSQHPIDLSTRTAVCFFGQIRDIDAFARLRDSLGAIFDADIFVATWSSSGARQIEPQGPLDFVHALMPVDLKDWFAGKNIQDFADLRERLPDLYDLLIAEHTDPIDELTIRGDSRNLTDVRLEEPSSFNEAVAALSGGAFERQVLHVQNQIRMWYLVNRVLSLRRDREQQNKVCYGRVVLLRTDLVFDAGGLERLPALVEGLDQNEILSDFDAIAWTIGGIGDRYFAGHSKSLDALMMPWRHVSKCFAYGGGESALFLRDLAPHKIARDLLFAANLTYRPVGPEVVTFQISRESTKLYTRIRAVATADQQRT